MFEEAAADRNSAPSKATTAASVTVARRKFRYNSEPGRLVSGSPDLSWKYSKSALRMAARPTEASSVQATVRPSSSTTSAATARGALPSRIRERACRIRAGCRVRSNNISPAVTGRVARYSRKENASRAPTARPKLHRQAISARPSEGRRNMVWKPSSVGECRFMRD